MGQTTLYKNDFLRVVDEDDPAGRVLWIADDLDEMEVSLNAEQVAEVLPVLSAWLEKQAARPAE